MTPQGDCIGIVGSGAMGTGIAQIAAASGCRVRLVDSRAGAAEKAADSVKAQYARMAEKGRMTLEAASEASARLLPGVLADLADCEVVIEAIIEALAAKQDLIRELETIVGDQTILATNTSSLSVTSIAAASRRPDRIAGFHFFNPVPMMKLVEVIPGLRSADWVSEKLLSLGRSWGHEAVLAKDSPGFLVNHAGRAYGTEAFRLLDEGVGDVATIDRCLRDQAGFRMGPFELMDLTALDVSIPVMESIFSQYFGEPRYRPSPTGRLRLTAGLVGRKTGEGFYHYGKDQPTAPLEPTLGPTPDRSIWIQPDHPQSAALQNLILAAGLRSIPNPKPGALHILLPETMDCTDAALAAGVNPADTVAVDGWFGVEKRLVAMTNPATSSQTRDDARALLAATGKPVSVISDNLGFIAPRVVVGIINLGCAIAQQGVASPEDINRAVTLGLGYPHGPLDWGDQIGPARVLALLRALQTATGDPRYRPAEWLTRRTKLGLSLSA